VTISWAFICGLLAAGVARLNLSVSPALLIAAWLAADPLMGAVASHLLTLREMRLLVRELVSSPYEGNQPLPAEPRTNGQKWRDITQKLWKDLTAFPGLLGHSLAALATAIAALVIASFIGPYAVALAALCLLGLGWIAILTGDNAVEQIDLAGGLQSTIAFLLGAAVMSGLSGRLAVLAALLLAGALLRPVWLRTRLYRLGGMMAAVWAGIVTMLLWTRQPVPAALVGCIAIADWLCLRYDIDQPLGFLSTQTPWLVALLLIGLAAGQWA